MPPPPPNGRKPRRDCVACHFGACGQGARRRAYAAKGDIVDGLRTPVYGAGKKRGARSAAARAAIVLSVLLHAAVIGAVMWEPAEALPEPPPVEAIEVEIVPAEDAPEPPAPEEQPEPEPTLEELRLNFEDSDETPTELEALATDSTPAPTDAAAEGDPEQAAAASDDPRRDAS